MKIASIDIHDDGSVTASQQLPHKVMNAKVPTISIYARFFNKANYNWSTSQEANLMFLKCQERYANDILKIRGYLFLNEVYDMVGLPKTKLGQCVGWLYRSDNPVGDNYIDFGLNADHNREFINGTDNIPLLDFNVDGLIIDKI